MEGEEEEEKGFVKAGSLLFLLQHCALKSNGSMLETERERERERDREREQDTRWVG